MAKQTLTFAANDVSPLRMEDKPLSPTAGVNVGRIGPSGDITRGISDPIARWSGSVTTATGNLVDVIGDLMAFLDELQENFHKYWCSIRYIMDTTSDVALNDTLTFYLSDGAALWYSHQQETEDGTHQGNQFIVMDLGTDIDRFQIDFEDWAGGETHRIWLSIEFYKADYKIMETGAAAS